MSEEQRNALVTSYQSYVQVQIEKHGENDDNNKTLTRGLSVIGKWRSGNDRRNYVPAELKYDPCFYHLTEKQSRWLYKDNLSRMYKDVRTEVITKDDLNNFLSKKNQTIFSSSNYQIHVKNPDFHIFLKLDENYFVVYSLHTILMRFHGFNGDQDHVLFNFSREENNTTPSPSFEEISQEMCPHFEKQSAFIQNFIRWIYTGVFTFNIADDLRNIEMAHRFGIKFNLARFVKTSVDARDSLEETGEKFELLMRKGQRKEFENMGPMQRLRYVVSISGDAGLIERIN